MSSPRTCSPTGSWVDTDRRPSNAKDGHPETPVTVSSSPFSPAGSSRSACSSISGPSSGWGPLSPDVADRVFPIRSVVNIEPSARPGSRPASTSSGHEGTHTDDDVSSYLPSRRHSVYNAPSSSAHDSGYSGSASDSYAGAAEGTPLPTTAGGDYVIPGASESERSNSEAGNDATPGDASPAPDEGFFTARHQYVMTEDGHMIVTGLGDSERMQRCEDEPIHIPGAVQGFGALVAFRQDDDGGYDVRIASENTKEIIGYSPAELFQLSTFCNILSDEQAENLVDHVNYIQEDCDPRQNGPEVFSLVVTAKDQTQLKLWCAIHVPEKNPDLFICEFELEDDQKYPLSNAPDFVPASPEDTLGGNPTEEEVAESTMSLSKPLRVLRHARRRRGEAAAMEVFNLMSQIQEQLASAQELETFLKIVVGVVKELAGFHRAMIYQFDEAWNGQVVTELVDYRATKDLYKGLHFPASDIPAQARELYQSNKVRLLYDRDQPTARLVCQTQEDLETPLDLTHSYLRAMSPVHLKYLKNMQVRASMSISITAFDQLWGLVSCHSYGPKGMRVSFPIRKMCQLIGETTSRNIERLSYAKRLHARKLINTVPTEQNPGGYIVASSDDLLSLFDADFGLLSIRDETKVLGKLENSQESLAMLEYLRMRNFNTVITSQDLRKDFPDLKYAPGFSVIAGLLLVPLSHGGSDFIVFFRKGQLRHVHWAGNPYQKNLERGEHGYLEPRSSFKIWSETVIGKSREWTEEQVETAAVLCLVYGKFIEVWRQKEAALKTSQLTRLLLANASHEVRTPLNAIINYLEIALEGPLDNETRDNLAKSHSASKSLIYVINDLLDLTRTEGGHDLIQDEEFELHDTITTATDVFKSDAQRKNISFEVVEHPGLPKRVKGDHLRLRQVLSNITGNAIKHTSTGGIKVEAYPTMYSTDRCEIEMTVEDTGAGMSPEKLDALFREFEQVHPEDEGDLHSQASDSDGASFNALSKIPGQRTLGLGLAIVARTIRNMKGQLRLKSEEGRGSKFTVCVPLSVPDAEEQHTEGFDKRETPAGDPTSPSSGEVTLVDSSRHVQKRPSMNEIRRNSAGSSMSTMSGNSARSGQSEIDRLVYAISSPHLIDGKPGPTRSSSSDLPGSGITGNTTPTAGNTETLAAAGRPSGGTQPSTLPIYPPPCPGEELVNDSAVPVKAVRVSDGTSAPQFNLQLPPAGHAAPPGAEPQPVARDKFSVLVAEDDPVNSKIITKRLERMGHTVKLTVNGEECLEVFRSDGSFFNVILMDMQMPIMDGGTSTTCIRKHEEKAPLGQIPEKHQLNGRITIFAVSASLVESRKDEYMNIGFDGWILKPIDFKRLDILLAGIMDERLRRDNAYEPGQWERGGWFEGSMPGR